MVQSHSLVMGALCALVASSTVRGDLPAPTGDRSVGVVTCTWVDPTRPDDFTVDPDDHRPVVASVWYPATAGETGTNAVYAEDLINAVAPVVDQVQGQRRAIAESVMAQRGTALVATVDAPFDQSARPAPLLVVSPGGNMSRYWHSALAQEFASRGWVVAVLSHAHSGLDVFPGIGLLDSNSKWNDLPDPVDSELADLLAGDARLALDRLLNPALDSAESRFAGRINENQIAILGHSRGGKTVSRACTTDGRIRAAVIFDNIGPRAERERGLDQPLLNMRTDDPRRWSDDSIEALHTALSNTHSVGYEVVLAGAGHMSFTDLPFVNPERAGAAIESARAHEVISVVVVEFLRQSFDDPANIDIAPAAAPYPELTVTRYHAD